MADIALTTFSARYHHAAFGLRYLMANLGDLERRSAIIEFDLEKRPADAVERVLAEKPRIVGLAVYVWNTRQCTEFAQLLRAVAPEVRLVIGGPEVSFPDDQHPIASVADHVICGEADFAFAQVCRAILDGQCPSQTVLSPIPNLTQAAMPYRLYSDEDLEHRTIYVESSRGCPFSCEFCLSSLDIPVRRFPLDAFLAEMQLLLDRGARQFKFVDRTFNLNVEHSARILQFFLERARGSGTSHVSGDEDNAACAATTYELFLHFEIIPDHLPEPIFDLLARFPAGSLQLEIGVQTFDEDVAARIGRCQDNAKAEQNLRRLREHTSAHIHADLIAGLPGESFKSFAAGFDRLLSLRPHEIQLGILKRLRGAPIARHTSEFAMVYSPEAPYEILQNHLIDFATMQRLKRMARYWDLFANSGNFIESLPLLWRDRSAFHAFMAFADSIYATTGKTHQLALPRQFELLFDCLGRSTEAGEALARDYLRPGRRDLPAFLETHAAGIRTGQSAMLGPTRQARHRA